MEKAKQRFAQVRGENMDDWFAEAQTLTPDMLAGAMGAGSGQNGIPNMGGMNPASATPPSSMALAQ